MLEYAFAVLFTTMFSSSLSAQRNLEDCGIAIGNSRLKETQTL